MGRLSKTPPSTYILSPILTGGRMKGTLDDANKGPKSSLQKRNLQYHESFPWQLHKPILNIEIVFRKIIFEQF
jgi:hypothetical protein